MDHEDHEVTFWVAFVCFLLLFVSFVMDSEVRR